MARLCLGANVATPPVGSGVETGSIDVGAADWDDVCTGELETALDSVGGVAVLEVASVEDLTTGVSLVENSLDVDQSSVGSAVSNGSVVTATSTLVVCSTS